ncbi:MAG: hypothetical protein R3254_00910 [Thiomicrorhabdus sp.]|nr:hypothetical protein [Thiomicrorhabdus sp.]
MVNTMRVMPLSLLALLWIVFFAPALWAADAQVTRPGNVAQAHNSAEAPAEVRIRPTKVQLGQPVHLVIEGEKIGKSTAQLDWTQLKQHFVIADVDQHSYLLRLTLYPLKAGEFTIAEQNAGRVHIPKTLITVEANPEVNIEWQKPKAQLYSSQQAVWLAQVKVKNPAFLVEITPPAGHESQGVLSHQFALPNNRERKVISFEMPSVTQSQTIQLKSPTVEVKNTSNQRWRFFDSPQSIEVKPLPSFVPMAVAVGELDWHIEPLNAIYQVGNLYYWHWQLIGEGIGEGYLKSTAYQLIGQLTHNEQLTWLAESMQVKQLGSEKGQVTQLDIQIPFRVKQPGLVDFPTLILRSFNPHQAKVAQQTFIAGAVMALPSWLVWLFNWIAFIMVLVLGYVSLLVLKQAWLNRVLQKQIKQAKTREQILEALFQWQSQQLMAFMWANKAEKIRSLQQFVQWYQHHYGESQTLLQLINDMNNVLYGKPNQTVAFSKMKNNAQAWSQEPSIIKGAKLAVKQRIKQVKQIKRGRLLD